MLADMIIEDVNWVCSFKDDFKLLCENLAALECLLTELGERWHSASVSKWIESLEDIVEDGIVIVERRQEENKKGGNRLLRNPLFFLQTAKELKSLKKS